VVALLVLIADPLIRFMFTDTYAAAVPIFQINSLIKLNLVFNVTLVLRAMDRNDISIWVNLGVLAATPLLLQLGLEHGGMAGVITAQLALVLGGRLISLALANRISGARLAYLITPRELWDFYREASRKGWGWVGMRLVGRGAR
jgi:O-antigen/teichoic acid export membrane protein